MRARHIAGGLGVVLIETTYGPSKYGTTRNAGGVVTGAFGLEAYPSGNRIALSLEARAGLWIGEPLETDVPGDGGFPFGIRMGPVEPIFEIHFGVLFRT